MVIADMGMLLIGCTLLYTDIGEECGLDMVARLAIIAGCFKMFTALLHCMWYTELARYQRGRNSPPLPFTLAGTCSVILFFYILLLWSVMSQMRLCIGLTRGQCGGTGCHFVCVSVFMFLLAYFAVHCIMVRGWVQQQQQHHV